MVVSVSSDVVARVGEVVVINIIVVVAVLVLLIESEAAVAKERLGGEREAGLKLNTYLI